MLLKGATLLSEPCPYCSGVRVMKDGYALCTLGVERNLKKGSYVQKKKIVRTKSSIRKILEKKINYSKDLEKRRGS